MKLDERNRPFRRPHASTIAAALALSAALAGGCKSSSDEKDMAPSSSTAGGQHTAQVQQEIAASATVLSVNRSSRLLTLQKKDGKSVVVEVPPEVRNFDQIQAGDKVTVRYTEAVAASIVEPGQAVKPASATVAAGTAEPGMKPAAAVGGQMSATVRIESIDLEKNIVVFTPPEGGMQAVHVVRPEGQKFIRTLKAGDQVEITYTTAMAISVEKP